MIQNLDYFDVLGALHRLPKLVVVHQDQLALHFPEEVRFGENADHPLLVVQYRESLEL